MTYVLHFLQTLVSVIATLTPFLPLFVALVRYVGKRTKNQNIILLSQRAGIIVQALTAKEFQSMLGPAKKEEAVRKLANYSTEVGIKMTKDQLEDYIEYAYKELERRSDELG